MSSLGLFARVAVAQRVSDLVMKMRDSCPLHELVIMQALYFSPGTGVASQQEYSNALESCSCAAHDAVYVVPSPQNASHIG